ncbi:MAG: hypothetical protein ACTHOG_07865 [Marmoricola sp.]
MPRLVVFVLAGALCAGCSNGASRSSADASDGASSPPAISVPALPQPFPSAAATPLPAGTVHIPLAGTDAPSGPELSADPRYVWSAGFFRIDPSTNKAVEVVGGGHADDVLSAAGSVWVSDFEGSVVRRYTPAGKLLATIRGVNGPETLVMAAGALWVADHHGGSIDRIDIGTNKVTDRITVTTPGPSGVQGLTVGLGSLWGGAGRSQTVSRVNVSTRLRTLTIDLAGVSGDPCGGVAVTPAAGWVSSCLDTTQLDEFDPRTGKVLRATDIDAKVNDIVADGSTIWFVAGGDPDPNNGPHVAGVLVQLDRHWKVLHKYLLGPDFTSGGIVKAFGALWVSNSSTPEVVRVPIG